MIERICLYLTERGRISWWEFKRHEAKTFPSSVARTHSYKNMLTVLVLHTMSELSLKTM